MAAAKKEIPTSEIVKRAHEIMAAEGIGFLRAKLRAGREMFDLPEIEKPMTKQDVRQIALNASPLNMAILSEIASDERCSPDTRVMAADKSLSFAARMVGDSGVEEAALLDPDPDV